MSSIAVAATVALIEKVNISTHRHEISVHLHVECILYTGWAKNRTLLLLQ